MSETPTVRKSFSDMDRGELLATAFRLEQETLSERIVRVNAEGDRDAAERRFVEVRAENDDLQEEVIEAGRQREIERAMHAQRVASLQKCLHGALSASWVFGVGLLVAMVGWVGLAFLCLTR